MFQIQSADSKIIKKSLQKYQPLNLNLCYIIVYSLQNLDHLPDSLQGFPFLQLSDMIDVKSNVYTKSFNTVHSKRENFCFRVVFCHPYKDSISFPTHIKNCL